MSVSEASRKPAVEEPPNHNSSCETFGKARFGPQSSRWSSRTMKANVNPVPPMCLDTVIPTKILVISTSQMKKQRHRELCILPKITQNMEDSGPDPVCSKACCLFFRTPPWTAAEKDKEGRVCFVLSYQKLEGNSPSKGFPDSIHPLTLCTPSSAQPFGCVRPFVAP